MQPSRLLLLPIVVALSLSSVSVIVSGQNVTCYDIGNFTANDKFQTTLDGILDSIATTTSSTMTYGLFNASTSQQQNTEAVEVIGYCHGDLDGQACRACLNLSAYEIRQHCPVQKRAVFYEVNCTLKYSNGSLYGIVDMTPGFPWYSKINVSNWGTFVTGLNQLLDKLRGQASSGGPIRKYAEGTSMVDLIPLYATVQCSPDLSEQQCNDCLVEVIGKIDPGKIGARMLWPSCQMRYETSSFFDPVAVPLPPPPPPPAEPSTSTPPVKKKSSKTWIIVVASTVPTVLLIGIIGFWITTKRKRPFSQRLRNEDPDDEIVVESLQFNLDIIAEATKNFSDAKKLGQGGFGSVYLGKLPNGQEIAVKRLSKNSGQGELEFKNEVVLLARLQHRNLVRLLGFCLEGDERLLIYEFVPNSSLDQFIFDPLKRARLDWDTRYKIITGIARGLVYLHEDSRLRIIHRDLKASNVLLDTDMNPKVSDFGMARLFELDQTRANTNRIVGTYGYMAPEYIMHGHFSLKSDVFSFGVLVLEIVSGRKNLNTDPGRDPEILISNIWRSWQEGRIPSIVDPLVTSGYSAEIMRCVHIGLLCVQENEANRPTMASIILMLNSHSISLAVPTQPAFLMSTSYTSEISSSIDGTSVASQAGDRNRNNMGTGTHSVNEISNTEPSPR